VLAGAKSIIEHAAFSNHQLTDTILVQAYMNNTNTKKQQNK